jgi:hypothetical protein
MKCRCGEDMVDTDIPKIHKACPKLVLGWNIAETKSIIVDNLFNHDAVLEGNIEEITIKGEVKI